MSKSIRSLSPVLAGLMVFAAPIFSQAAQAQTIPTIQYGDHGATVVTAERTLATLGYYHGSLDGVFGSELLAAVESFQAHYGLAQDGIIGPQTWAALSATAGTSNSQTAVADSAHATTSHSIQLGSRGPGVLHLQKLLNKYGYNLTVDGAFGPLTYAAVRDFQAAHSLPVTGVASSETIAVLEHPDTTPKTSAPAPSNDPPGYLHEGDKGPKIRVLQEDLTRAGYSTGGADGIFGPQTKAAVVAFQRAQGLPSYGLVGSLTWTALKKALGTSAAPLSNRGSISPTATAIVGIAMKYVGYPYVWGGNTPSGFDCSGFVQWVYSQVGISLPRTSFTQWDAGTHVAYDDLQPGDLVFFTTYGVFTNHVGIYLGGGEFISAADPGQGVVVQSLDSSFFSQAYDGAVQILS